MTLLEDQDKLKAMTVGIVEALVCIESAVIQAANQDLKINGGISSVRVPFEIGLSTFDLVVHFQKSKNQPSTSIEVDIDYERP